MKSKDDGQSAVVESCVLNLYVVSKSGLLESDITNSELCLCVERVSELCVLPM